MNDCLMSAFLLGALAASTAADQVPHPIRIKIALLRQGLTAAKIARELGTRRDMVSQMFNELRYYPGLAKRIEERYGIVCRRTPHAQRRESKARRAT